MIPLLIRLPQLNGSRTQLEGKLHLPVSNSSSSSHRRSHRIIHRRSIPLMRHPKVLLNHSNIFRSSNDPLIRHSLPISLHQFPARHKDLLIRRWQLVPPMEHNTSNTNRRKEVFLVRSPLHSTDNRVCFGI